VAEGLSRRTPNRARRRIAEGRPQTNCPTGLGLSASFGPIMSLSSDANLSNAERIGEPGSYSPRLWSDSPSHRYGIAVFVTAVAMALHILLTPVLGLTLPYITVYPAIVIVAVRFGFGPAVLSTLLGFAAAEWFLIEPLGTSTLGPSLFIRAAIVLLSGVYIGHVGDKLRISAARAESKATVARLLSGAVEAAANGIAITDRDGRVLWVNAAFTQLTGYSPAEVVGKNPRVLKSGRHAPDVYREMWETILNGKVWRGEIVNKRKEGSLYTEEMTITPIRSGGGAVTHFIAVKQDITARRQAAEALRASERRLNRAEEIAHLGSWELDLPANRLSWSNEAYRIFGLRPQEFGATYEAFLAYVHPDDRAAVDSAYANSIRDGCNHYEIEHRIVRATTGEVRIVHEKCEHFRDETGRIVRSGGMVHDITERKRAEVAIRSQNERLVALHEMVEALLAASDPTAVLGRLQTRLGLHQEADEVVLLVRAAGDAVRLEPDRSRRVSDAAAEVEQMLATEPVNARFTRRMGEGCCGYYPLLVDGRLLGGLAFLRRRGDFDVVSEDFFQTISRNLALALDRARLETELRMHANELEQAVAERTARLEATVAELEHFSYTITHDMRAPLRAIQGFGEVMLEEGCAKCDNPAGREYLRRIAAAARRMDQLIIDALSYSRIVRGDLEMAAVDPNTLIREILESYPQFQEPKAEIRLEGELPAVFGNEAMLTQVFSNLLGNAVKFVEPGVLPVVRISAERGDHVVRIDICDNGIGIPAAMHARVFDMFSRLSHRYEGTGIGLAIVGKAVERMRGRIGLDSEPGRGSRFWVELPPVPIPADGRAPLQAG
jgi:PAS domain S-box-containing protein